MEVRTKESTCFTQLHTHDTAVLPQTNSTRNIRVLHVRLDSVLLDDVTLDSNKLDGMTLDGITLDSSVIMVQIGGARNGVPVTRKPSKTFHSNTSQRSEEV